MSIYEAWLFSFLGQVVDLLTTWQQGGEAAAQESRVLWGMGIVMVVSVGLVALQTMVQRQILAINLPLRLCWDFHRPMLRHKSVGFFRRTEGGSGASGDGVRLGGNQNTAE